jgi:hypothetical protein
MRGIWLQREPYRLFKNLSFKATLFVNTLFVYLRITCVLLGDSDDTWDLNAQMHMHSFYRVGVESDG